MKTKFEIILCLVVLFFTKPAICQKDTVFYTGVNGRLESHDRGDIMKKVKYKSSSMTDILTFKKTGKLWKKIYSEQITLLKDKTYQIRAKGEGIAGITFRKYEDLSNGGFKFSEYNDQTLLKDGHSLRKFPLILNGEVTEYYLNGNVKSKSVYRNNELLSNKNWLETGEKYIDSIFYSVDEEPTLFGGNTWIHQHIRKAFTDTGLDFSSVSGSMLLGFVVMETGDIAGIRVIRGLSQQLNGIALSALQTLGGKWKPARLNGRDVRYFQLFPINFISRETKFQYMEFDGSMIHYNYD